MSRGGIRKRKRKEHVRRASDLIPIPKHPYRDSAIFYGILSGCLVVVTYFTAGRLVQAIVIAVGFFVVATGFSWWKFREKLAREAERT